MPRTATRIAYEGPFFLKSSERLNNSRVGNPRFRIVLEDSAGNAEMYVTKADASCSYDVENFSRKPHAPIMVSFTKARRVDCMRPATPVDTLR